jgi:serine/threonine protein kinase
LDRADLLDHNEADNPSAARRGPGSEPFPGYRLVELLGKGGFGEVWKCEAPGGLCKAIKFVPSAPDALDLQAAPAAEELRAIQLIKSIRHPFILSMERIERLNGELAIVMELADRNLASVLADYRAMGRPGIPRDELLGYLREAAEALDMLNEQHGLQHLDIKPGNLFLVSKHIKVADFGLVTSLSARQSGPTAQVELGGITPLYSSPEIFQGRISPQSDQYSLAIVYQELLTGTLPFQGKNVRQLLLQHTTDRPHLDALPPGDRVVVARALAKHPAMRFASCNQFVKALLAASTTASPQSETPLPGSHRTVRDVKPAGGNGAAEPQHPGREAGTGRRQLSPANRAALPGYEFLTSLGCSPLAEVWKVRDPDGRERIVKFLYGIVKGNKQRPGSAVQRLRNLTYPTLLPVEVLRIDPGRLILATDPIEQNLAHRLHECQAQGLRGIPRAELLSHLRTAAESLDYLYQQHAIQHLGLSPRNLLLDNGRLLIGDFGLIQLFWLPAEQSIAQLSGRYAAPELGRRQVSPACDQYSLALIYHDLVTGARHSGPVRRPSNQGAPPPMELTKVAGREKEILVRALDPDANQRWPNLTQLVQALEEASGEVVDRPVQSTEPAFVPAAVPVSMPPPANPEHASPDAIIQEVVSSASQAFVISTPGVVLPGAGSQEDEALLRKFTAPIPLGTARLKLEEFCQQCRGEKVREEERTLVFRVDRPRNLWQQCAGKQPGLEVEVHLHRPRTPSATPIDVTVQIRPYGCGHKNAASLLKGTGSVILESLRTCLQITAERRLQERLIWHKPVGIRAVLPNGALGEIIECQGKDISLSGIGFYLPQTLPTTQIFIHLPTGTGAGTFPVPASIVRVQRCGDGWYDVGALFLRDNNSPPATANAASARATS